MQVVDMTALDLPDLARRAGDTRVRAVDLFAGWGGFTQGAKQAGAHVVWAANHWPLAVEAHAHNHPDVVHSCQELGGDTDFSQLPDFDLLLASPACQGGSRAAQPSRARSERVRRRHDQLRATALAVIGCADICEPKAIIVENVEEFRSTWRLYPRWRQMLEDIGYHVQELMVRASHLHVPQRRDRLFIVATKRGEEIQLPEHPEPAFGPCIDWEADEPWTPIRSATEAVKARIAKGRKRCGKTFLTQHVTGHPGVPLDEPIRTITTKDQWAVVDGRYYRALTVREYARGMGFPDHCTWPASASKKKTIMGLGNAVPPAVAREVISRVCEVM